MKSNCLAVVVLLAVHLPTNAQSLGTWTPETSDHLPPPSREILMGPHPSATGYDSRNLWSADLLLGLPTGVRLQRSLGPDPDSWLVEGFLGLEAIVPVAGLGVRRPMTYWSGPEDAIVISPGADLYLGALPFTFSFWGESSSGVLGLAMIALDVDLVWRHTWFDAAEGELGLKLGAGALGGNFGFFPAPFPVASVFLGCRF